MLADDVLLPRRRLGVTFRPVDENKPRNRIPPKPKAKAPPVAFVRQKLSFDDQDTLTLTPDQFAPPISPPSLRQLLDDYARFAAADSPSDDSPFLRADHTSTLEFDREVRNPEFRTINLSVSEDSFVEFHRISREGRPRRRFRGHETDNSGNRPLDADR
jgi:hypothetical protein